MIGVPFTGPIPYEPAPCRRCPWRRDTSPGEFPAERYEVLRSTSPQHEDDEPAWDAGLFQCHKSSDAAPTACAGWLASVAHRHLGVRLALAQRRLPWSVMQPGDNWPVLFESYPEMAAAQADRTGRTGEGR